ncbi:terpenoid cyclases/protein prenyltransferase alpha-alpha toroid, partial [Ochromonadaceae sp. CCMP2298]
LTPQLAEGVAEYVQSCQTYEGGFGGEPGNEAHGGYNFCAIATLLILKKQNLCDLAALEGWLLRRQTRLEGGFQGRTNKLVDSCYSFWQGSALAILEIVKSGGSDVDATSGCLSFNQQALQRYILHCAQNLEGGLRDKPGKARDFYHSCYALSGLSIAQNCI